MVPGTEPAYAKEFREEAVQLLLAGREPRASSPRASACPIRRSETGEGRRSSIAVSATTARPMTSATSCASCGARTSGSSRNETCSNEPRPTSPSRPRPGERLWIRPVRVSLLLSTNAGAGGAPIARWRAPARRRRAGAQGELPLLGKGAVSAHRIERPFAPRLDEYEQRPRRHAGRIAAAPLISGRRQEPGAHARSGRDRERHPPSCVPFRFRAWTGQCALPATGSNTGSKLSVTQRN